MDEFLDLYLFYWRNPVLPFEAAEIHEFHRWLPASVYRAAEVISKNKRS